MIYLKKKTIYRTLHTELVYIRYQYQHWYEYYGYLPTSLIEHNVMVNSIKRRGQAQD